MSKDAWFNNWFNSSYYHILYKNRDETEAQNFINNLASFLDFKAKQKALDLACGKGRHAIYLNKKGLDVIGIDLADQNIAEAKLSENQTLHFYKHDMRKVFMHNTFDYIFNLFTSIGYFETDEENQQVISSAAEGLKKGGFLIIDFLNTHKVINTLIPEEKKLINNITFHIKKYLDSTGYIVKEIRFHDNNKDHFFYEKVKAIEHLMFLEYFKHAKLQLIHTWGNYDLEPFEKNKSDRMIFLAKKD